MPDWKRGWLLLLRSTLTFADWKNPMFKAVFLMSWQSPVCLSVSCRLTVRNADRKPANMRKSMGWTASRDNVIIRADMRLKCQVQTWCFDRCLSPMRKVSGTMDFAEMCVTRLEQELCTQNFFFHSLSWWSIMGYEKLRFLILDFKQSFLYSWNYGGQKWIIFYECVWI